MLLRLVFGEKYGLTLRKRGFVMDFFLCVLGMVMVVEGFPYFAFPDKMKIWVRKVLEMPESSLRKFGLFMMVIGLGLVYLGRR